MLIKDGLQKKGDPINGSPFFIFCVMSDSIRHLFLFEDQRNEFAEVDAPVAPDVAAVGFHEGVRVFVLVELDRKSVV